jgi:carboxyl-terminal processing protease
MRARASILAALVGCSAPSPAPEPEVVAKGEAPAESSKVPRDVPAPEACPDYSTLDPSTLPPLPASKHAATLQDVWVRVLQKHFDPKLGCKDWPALRLQYAEELVGVDDEKAAWAVINRMLGELGQSHFRLFPKTADDGDDHAGPAKPPLSVRWIEDRLVVVKSTASGHLGPVRAGATLLAIDDEPITDAIEAAREHATRPSAFAFEIARKAEARLSCGRAGQSKKVKVTDPKDRDREVIRMLTCVDPVGERITLGNLENIPTVVESRMIEGTKVGVLHFNVWMLPMVKRVEEAMTSLRGKGMTALVLDLRGNPGGIGHMAVPVARMLLSEAGSLGQMQYREFTQNLAVDVGADPFTGPVAILVDEGTASTSEIFVAGLRDLGRITVVGAGPSAGAALPSVIEELPGGAVLQYVVGDYHSPKGTLVEGKGVEPDVVVVETRADFAAGRDPVLQAAVKHLQEKE